MSRKQRVKVIFAEGTYIALSSTFIALIVGFLGVSGNMVNRTDLPISYGASLFIAFGLILLIGLISVLVCIIPAKKLESESIVDTLKEDM